jgi:hypothetical protein
MFAKKKILRPGTELGAVCLILRFLKRQPQRDYQHTGTAKWLLVAEDNTQANPFGWRIHCLVIYASPIDGADGSRPPGTDHGRVWRYLAPGESSVLTMGSVAVNTGRERSPCDGWDAYIGGNVCATRGCRSPKFHWGSKPKCCKLSIIQVMPFAPRGA